MAFAVWILALLLQTSLVRNSGAVILCDEGCLSSPNATELGICINDTTEERTPLYLMGFFPCNGPDFRGRGLTVAGQMAVRAVNLNSSILQDYRLELSFSNTKVKMKYIMS